MSLGAKGRRLLALGAVTALCAPLSLTFLFILYWVYPSMNGYPVCDPGFQQWCEYDPTVRPRLVLGISSAVVAGLCLVTAYVLPSRIRVWWPWAVAPVALLSVGIILLASIF